VDKLILRSKKVDSKIVSDKRIYAVTKKIFNAEKISIITVQKVNLKMLFTAFL